LKNGLCHAKTTTITGTSSAATNTKTHTRTKAAAITTTRTTTAEPLLPPATTTRVACCWHFDNFFDSGEWEKKPSDKDKTTGKPEKIVTFLSGLQWGYYLFFIIF